MSLLLPQGPSITFYMASWHRGGDVTGCVGRIGGAVDCRDFFSAAAGLDLG